MDTGKAKEYFELGLLTGVTVHNPNVLHEGWTIEFTGNLGSFEPFLRTARGEIRTFKSLDGVAKTIQKIGFRSWKVEIN